MSAPGSLSVRRHLFQGRKRASCPLLPLQAAQSAASIRMQLLGLIYPTVSMAAYIESGLGLNYTAVSSVRR